MFETLINLHNPEREYPQLCFNYIHNSVLTIFTTIP